MSQLGVCLERSGRCTRQNDYSQRRHHQTNIKIFTSRKTRDNVILIRNVAEPSISSCVSFSALHWRILFHAYVTVLTQAEGVERS